MSPVPGPNGLNFRNELLQALPVDETRRLRPNLTRIRLPNGFIVNESGQRPDHVLFVEEGFVSLVAEADGAESGVEVGLIGRESAAGLSVMLGPQAVPFNRAMVQMRGAAYRIPTATLQANFDDLPTLHRVMLQAFEGQVAQLAQTAACNGRHALPERLARWLLMAHDRVEGDELPLTQEFLAIMLGVRRSGVTIAVGALQAANLVRHSRGRIIICDRPGLEGAACPCYARVRTFIAAIAARENNDGSEEFTSVLHRTVR